MGFVLSEQRVSEDQLQRFRALMETVGWKSAPNRAYQTADVTREIPGYARAFFLKLPPHSELHPHVDAGDCRTDHIVLQTNLKALNWWIEGDEKRSTHMQAGFRFCVNRTIRHWATNAGNTDRIHLLLEY